MQALIAHSSMPTSRISFEVAMSCSPISTSVHAFYGQLQRYIGMRVHNATETEDLVQLVLERAVSKQPLDGEIENVAAWLFTIARNAVFDHQRRQQRALAKESLDEVDEPASEPFATPRDRDDVLACMQPLLAALPEDARNLLVWADMEERPLQSIADELGISLTATKSRVQRARKAFVEVTQRCCFITLDARGSVSELAPRRPNSTNPCDPTACSRKS
jgi:RNA polymerase sigma-70 factor (ECF subfamily)